MKNAMEYHRTKARLIARHTARRDFAVEQVAALKGRRNCAALRAGYRSDAQENDLILRGLHALGFTTGHPGSGELLKV